MYPTWLRMTLRHWTTTLLLLAILAALIGGVQSAAAQPEPPAVPEQPSRLLLPLTMNNASGADETPVQPQAEPQVVFEIRASETKATITTDQPDYPPGAVVTIIGAGWAAGEIVHIDVNDSVGQSWSYSSTPDVMVRDDGTFTHQFQLPDWFVANYGVVASGPTSGWASTTFTDLNIGTYDQCANDKGTGYTSGDSGCKWINGDLNGQNSIYYEGDSTVQRVWLTDLPVGPHSVTLQYGTTKGGKHAYDYLTNWNWSETWIQVADLCQGIAGCTNWPVSTLPMTDDPNVPNTIEPTPGPRFFSMYNGTLTSASIPQIESGSYTGDSETIITIGFNVDPTTAKDCETKSNVTTCSIALFFGAHVSSQVDWGVGQGAASISGSPYHVKLYKQDGTSIGQRDNQMQASAVTPNGTIVIEKEAVPTSAQDFSFNLNNNATISQNFALDDDSELTLPNSRTVSVPPGTWYASELGLPISGWDFTSLVCVDPTNNTTVSGAAAIINLASNETVTCTYTNTKRGTIVVKKVTSGGDAAFGYTTTGGNGFPASFNITTSSGQGSQTYTNIVPGAYSVAETPLTGWTQAGASCDSGTPDSFTVLPGGTVTCTFTNTRAYNKDLTVSKTAVGAFNRDYRWTIDKSVDKTRIEIAEGGTATFNYSVKVTPNGYTDSNWTVSGKITVANPNSFAVDGVNVADTINNGGTCTVTGGSNVMVAANSNVVLDYTCIYTAGPTAQVGTNTATATWNAVTFDTPSGSAAGTASADFSAVAPAVTNSTITVMDDKTASPTSVTLGTWNWADGEHTFTYALEKQGVAGTCKQYDNIAKITETGQTDIQAVSVCVGKDLKVSKTAAGTFARTYLWKIGKDVDQTLVKIADGASYAFHYTVQVDQTGVTDGGWTLSGKITLSNPNDWEAITLTGLTDVADNGGTCTVDTGPYVVPKSGSLDVNYRCTYSSAPSSNSGTNTATVTWDRAAAFTPSDSASGSAPFTLAQAGVTNKTVSVTDSYGGSLGTLTATDNEPFAAATFTYDRTEKGTAGKCTSYDNSAKITETGESASKSVELCVGTDLMLTKTAVGTFDRTYLWKIGKAVDQTLVKIVGGSSYTFQYIVDVKQTGLVDAGWTLSGKISLENPNDWEDITLTSLSDVVSNGGACVVDPGPYKVLAGKTLDVAYTCSYGAAPSSYSGTNIATANWDAAAAFTPGSSTSGSAAFTLAQAGATNKIVHITDTVGGNLGTVTARDVAPYANGTFTYSRTVSGVAGKCTTYDNTATITETGQSADKSVTVCVGKDLTLTKTAAGTFDRTYLWKISKSVDKTSVKMADGDSYTFHYTVDVEQTGLTDAGWTMAGKITVSNPNDWEDITLTSLSDTVDNGGTCTVAPGPYVVPKSGSLDVAYSCSYASTPSSYSGTNTATVNWDAATYFTPSGMAHGTAGFKLALADATNQTVSVTDSFKGNVGTVTATDSTPFAKASFTYDRTASGVAGKCTTYDNTATITETGQSADKSVTLCVGKNLTVSKTAVPSFTRTWAWSITKDFDATYNLLAGSAATHVYKVTVTPSSADSLWKVVGAITLHNPNDWEAIAVTSLADVVGNGGTCTVPAGQYVVPAGGSLDVAYICTYASAPSSYSGTNTATATWDKAAANTPSGTASGEMDFVFDSPTEIHPVVTVDDSNLSGEKWTADRSYAEWTYTRDFACSTNPADYKDGKDSYSLANTAKINETGLSDTVIVDVNCYSPVVTKNVTTYWNRDWDWTITKNYDATYNLFAGGTVTHDYKVAVAPTYTDNFWGVKGTITVHNGHPTADMTLTSLTDLAGGIGGKVTCDSLVVPANGSLNCTYDTGKQNKANANPFGDTNTATAVFAGADWTGTASIIFSTTPTTEDQPVITVDDNKLTGESWSADREAGEWTYTKDFACPTVASVYTNGKHSYSVINTAKINETGQTDTAKVDVNCFAPKVTKTADTYWNRDWDWTITKDYDATYNLFAGDTVSHVYKVAVAPTYTDNFWGVKGIITVYNGHPTEAMTLGSLTDLAGGVVGKVTCAGFVVPANGSLTCTYDTGKQNKPGANPFGELNTATATFAGVDWTGTAPITFNKEPTTEDQPVVTVDDDNLTNEAWSANRAAGEWTYTKDFACSTDASKYTDGKYSYSVTNTATIKETTQSDTAKVDVTCYWPQIELTKTGDTLSKIGDGVTYAITLENTTPIDAGLRELACSITDPTIGFSKNVTLASGKSDTSTKAFTIPSGAADPYLNTASVTCKLVDATAPVVGSTTFSVSDSSTWSTNLFQPKVEIIKTGPSYATSGDTIAYQFKINNLSSSDSPNLMLDSVSDNVLGDLKAAALAASCDNLVYNGTCTFTKAYTIPDVGLQSAAKTNIVTVHYHPAGFPNDITDADDHTVIMTPKSQLTDTSFCPLANNQFRLLYHLEASPNIYRLQASNPGQYYFNGFYYGTPGSDFTMTIQVPYPFVTQEGAGVPIQVHDGTGLTSGGCYSPNPSLSGFTIKTQAMAPTSSAGNQIITPDDYTTKNLGNATTVTVSGKVPATGMAYVTIHLDYGLKKTGSWKQSGTYTTNPVSGASIADVLNQTGFGSGSVTIKGYQVYNFARTAGGVTSTTTPASYNEFKKFAGFLGFMTDKTTGKPVVNGKITIYDPSNKLLTTLYTDADGYYMYAYKHTSKSATYTVKAPAYGKSTPVTVKANGFAAVDFDVDVMTAAIEAPDGGGDTGFIFMPMVNS